MCAYNASHRGERVDIRAFAYDRAGVENTAAADVCSVAENSAELAKPRGVFLFAVNCDVAAARFKVGADGACALSSFIYRLGRALAPADTFPMLIK